jgi:hypothetical protein
MSNTAVVVPAQNVQGNISTCQILNQQVRMDIAHWYSFTELDHYESFNTCTGQIVAEYDVPSLTLLWGIPLLLFVVILTAFVAIALSGKLASWLDS